MNLRNKLLAIILSIILICGFTTIFIVKNTMSEAIMNEFQTKGTTIARNLAVQSDDLILTENSLQLQRLITNTKNSEHEIEYIFITSPDNKVISHTFKDGFPIDLLNGNKLKNNFSDNIVSLKSDNKIILDFAYPVMKGEIATVRVGMSADHITTIIDETIFQTIEIILFIMVSGIISAFIMSDYMVKPVKKLRSAAIEIGKGHLDTRISVKSNDEIGELGLSFNKMAEDLKISNEKIISSLQEKEVLLREIHHRVKNNMQIISSLLNLQIDSVKDTHLSQALMESQNRITSMALIHEKLYRSSDLMLINFKEYVNDLAVGLFQAYGVNMGNIKLNINVEEISMDIDHAIPAGLIINELITNSIKYAFPEDRKGMIYINSRLLNDKQVEIVIGDNGIGIPEDLDLRNTRTLGLHLVTTLVENQLHGKIDLYTNKGSEFGIQFRGMK